MRIDDYIIAGGILTAGIIAFAGTWLMGKPGERRRGLKGLKAVAVNSQGVTDGTSTVVIHWHELEEVDIYFMPGNESNIDRALISLRGKNKHILIPFKAEGINNLQEGLKKLPNFDPQLFETMLFYGLTGPSNRVWSRNPKPSEPATLVILSGRQPMLASYLSETLIRWKPEQNAFELARFDKEPGNVADSLTFPFTALDGFRFWWRGSPLMSGWRHDGGEREPKARPPLGYYSLEIWPDDPEWAGFQIDLARDASGAEPPPILANLGMEWYARLGDALRRS